MLRLLVTATLVLVVGAATPAGIAVSFPEFKDPGLAFSDWLPTWSPDGARIAFASDRGDGYRRVFVMDADGTDARALTSYALLGPMTMKWAPNGDAIAFRQGGSWADDVIGVVSPAGGETRWLTARDMSGRARDADWAPTGDRLVFTRSESFGCWPSCWRGGDVFTIHPDGTGETNLTNSPADEAAVSWSPDGQLIAFTRRGLADCEYPGCGEHEDQDLWVMNADGSGERQLTASPADESAPAWSPDAAKLAFVREGSIYVLNADGAGERLVGAGTAFDWSPVGDELVAANGDDLVVYRVDGGTSRRLAQGLDFRTRPDWSPHGSRIVFHGVGKIMVDGTERRVTRIFVVDSDGSNLTSLPATSQTDAGASEPEVQHDDSAGAGPAGPLVSGDTERREATIGPRLVLRRLGGTRFLVRVVPTDSFVGRFVGVQRLLSEEWRGVKRIRLGAGSMARFSLRLRGPARIRAFITARQAGPDFRQGASRSLFVRR